MSEEKPGDNAENKDEFLDAIRDLPRLKSIERDLTEKPYVPPAPTTSRMGAFSQGCAGILLTISSIPMLMVAVAFGYDLWGPGVTVIGGLLLLSGVAGLWRGRRVPLVVGIILAIALFIVMYVWRYFVFAVAILSPLGAISDVLFGLAMAIGLLGLFATLVMHIISLFFWRRLLPPLNIRPMIMWGIGLVALIVLPILFHEIYGRQRFTWLEDRRDEWQAEASTDTLNLGANTGFSLGYTFTAAVTEENTGTVSPEDEFELRTAELRAMLETGASPIRVSASGDTLLELRDLGGDDESTATPEAESTEEAETEESASVLSEEAEEIAQRLDYEERYMAPLLESDAELFLADSQYSPYLLSQAQDNENEAMPWEDFLVLHEERIRHYASLYQPAIYAVVTEPERYAQYSAIEEPDGDEDDKLDAWVAHTSDLITAVQEESPDSRVAVTISIDSDFDQEYYERVLGLEGLDIITVELYQPVSYDEIQALMDERGHPRDFDQEMWITETWYGFCMAPQRSMELDSLWLETVVAFAAKEDISGVLPTSFGCFLQPGGTLTIPDPDLNGRTEVWETWRDLVQEWQPTGEE